MIDLAVTITNVLARHLTPEGSRAAAEEFRALAQEAGDPVQAELFASLAYILDEFAPQKP